ncbi:MAG: STAS domain-containing protein [Acidobacteriota bacterium]|nr:STAS domain-containing protein [Acidobacteriota bacterium]
MTETVSQSRFTLEIDRTPEKIVVRCLGELVFGVAGEFYKQVQPLTAETSHLVLDLSDLRHMDSMGLGTLVRLLVAARSHKCRLELVNLSKKVRELLDMTNLLSAFSDIGEHGIKL